MVGRWRCWCASWRPCTGPTGAGWRRRCRSWECGTPTTRPGNGGGWALPCGRGGARTGGERRGRLGGLGPLRLPADRRRPPVPTDRGAHLAFTLASEVTDPLRTLSRREEVTLFMSLLAAFQALLHRYTGQDDIAVGTPIAG